MKMKKLLSLVLSVFLICAISSPAFAVNETSTITQFRYTVFDAAGNVKTSGTTPNFIGRYSWSGITIENGQYAVFQKSDGKNFYCLGGTRVVTTVEKDRAAWTEFTLRNAINSTDTGGVVISQENIYARSFTRSSTLPSSPTVVGSDYYNFTIRNASSDPLTLTYVSLTF